MVWWILVGGAVVAAGFFSAAETAVLAVNRMRLRLRAESGEKGASEVLGLLCRPDRLMTTILFGNNVAVVSASALLTVWTEALAPEWAAIAMATIGATVLLTFFSEVVPKTVVLEDADYFATSFVALLRFFMKAFYPVTVVATGFTRLIDPQRRRRSDAVSREELRAVLAERWWRDPGETVFKRMVRNTFFFNETTVGDVMTPLENVKALPVDAGRDDVLGTVIATGHSKIPVYQGHVGNYVGVVLAKDFLEPRANRVGAYVRGVLTVTVGESVATVLPKLAARTVDMAVVYNEEGKTVGVLTLEDIFEEIVGEIWDEYDWTYTTTHFYPSFVVNGQTPIATLNRRLPDPLNAPRTLTLDSYVRRVVGRALRTGDVAVVPPYRFKVLRVTGGKCRLIRVDVLRREI